MQPEFSRIVTLDALGPIPERVEIEANAAERSAVAERLGLVALEQLSAQLLLERQGPGKVRLSGELRARAVQSCVVSLEPVTAELAESFAVHYADGERSEQRGDEILVEVAEDESPEPLAGGTIDIGEAVTQQLVLALDPYPRKPGAVAPASVEGGTGLTENGPFAALSALKKDR